MIYSWVIVRLHKKATKVKRIKLSKVLIKPYKALVEMYPMIMTVVVATNILIKLIIDEALALSAMAFEAM
tara:strand:+ start:635 stop:844 length:210 start_codon:yes stop_codon:yes gene_type:complete